MVENLYITRLRKRSGEWYTDSVISTDEAETLRCARYLCEHRGCVEFKVFRLPLAVDAEFDNAEVTLISSTVV